MPSRPRTLPSFVSLDEVCEPQTLDSSCHKLRPKGLRGRRPPSRSKSHQSLPIPLILPEDLKPSSALSLQLPAKPQNLQVGFLKNLDTALGKGAASSMSPRSSQQDLSPTVANKNVLSGLDSQLSTASTPQA